MECQKYDVKTCADDVIYRRLCENQGRHEVMPLLKSIKKSQRNPVVNFLYKSELNGNKTMSFLFLIHSKLIWSPEDPIATGTLIAILEFSTFFCLLTVYERSYKPSARDRIIQSAVKFAVRGETTIIIK